MNRKNLYCALIFLFFSMVSFGQADSARYYLKKGSEEKSGRRFRSAELSFIAGLRFAPDNKEMLGLLAETYKEQFKYNDAREIYLKIARTAPGDAAVLHNLAAISFNMHKWNDAIQYAAKLPADSTSAYITGRSQYELENYAEAVKSLTAAEKAGSRNAEVPYYLARAYMDQSNYKQSAAAFERAIAIDSSRANWVYETSLAFYAIPDYNKSLQYMLLAGARGFSRSSDYLENLANVYVRTNQPPEAIKLFKEILAKKPGDQEILYELAQSYYQTKQYDDAIANWDKVLAIDPANAKAMYMTGLSYQKKGDMARGTQLCEQAIKLDPSLKNLRQEKKGEF
ncbi:MAG TPA: tetratricopeptide repeat protein [Flavitalea sp.]|nr:tetratricopeptide repeat protein [Flavitalea sp.]